MWRSQRADRRSSSPGSQITYTITVTNNGPSAANAVSLTDPAPAGLSFTSLSGACSGTFPCSLGTMAAGATATVTAVYSIPPGYSGANPIVNTATVSTTTTDPTNGNNSSSVSTSVSASADLQVTKTGPAAVNPGDLINYTITVMNNGPSHATSVYLDDPIPPGLVFVSSSAPCAGGFVPVCSLGTINAGSSVTITLVLNVPAGYAGSSLTNTATATHSTPDPNTSNNTGSATTAVGTADLQVTKSGPASITPGQQITYTIAVLNNGPAAAAGVVLSDTDAGRTHIRLGISTLRRRIPLLDRRNSLRRDDDDHRGLSGAGVLQRAESDFEHRERDIDERRSQCRKRQQHDDDSGACGKRRPRGHEERSGFDQSRTTDHVHDRCHQQRSV